MSTKTTSVVPGMQEFWNPVLDKASKALAKGQLADGERAELIYEMEKTFRGLDDEIARQKGRRKRQLNVMQGFNAALLALVCFFWWQFSRVELKAKVEAYRMLLERSLTSFTTARAAQDVCLKQVVEWMKGVRTNEMDPETRDVRLKNLAKVGHVLEMNSLGYKANQDNIREALAHIPNKVDSATVLYDPVSGKPFVLNDTAGVHVDQNLLKDLLQDKKMLAGLMVQARVYSMENAGSVPRKDIFDLNPALVEATGVAYQLPSKASPSNGEKGK